MTIDVVETSKTPDRPPAGLPKQPNMKALERIRETGRHAVGDGLYLQVANGGARSWLYRYQQHGRRHDLGIGPFPAVTLAMAREAIIRVRQQLHRNEDPLAIRRAERAARPTNDATDFARRPNASAAAGDRPNELIGIVLVTHGNLAHELIAALEHVVGPQQGVVTVCIGADDDMEKQRDEILESAKACDTGDGVVVLTDMFGGTPSNLAISITEQACVEVLAGVNLPMLVKLASVRNRPIAEVVRMAQEAGRKYITVASRILAEESL